MSFRFKSKSCSQKSTTVEQYSNSGSDFPSSEDGDSRWQDDEDFDEDDENVIQIPKAFDRPKETKKAPSPIPDYSIKSEQ